MHALVVFLEYHTSKNHVDVMSSSFEELARKIFDNKWVEEKYDEIRSPEEKV
jgi:hypothetical protein